MTPETVFKDLTKSLDSALVCLDEAMEHFNDSVLLEQDIHLLKTPEQLREFQTVLEGYVTMSCFLIDHPLITVFKQIRNTSKVTNTDSCISAVKHSFKVGQKWQHYKGRVYTIVSIAVNSDRTYVESIHYTDGEKTWELPISAFAKKVVVNDEEIPRFTLVA